MNNGRAIDVEMIRKQVEADRAYLVELISAMVKFHSYSGEAEEIQRFLQGKLKELGMVTRLVKVQPEKLEQYEGRNKVANAWGCEGA